jgi:hypothetical protein
LPSVHYFLTTKNVEECMPGFYQHLKSLDVEFHVQGCQEGILLIVYHLWGLKR